MESRPIDVEGLVRILKELPPGRRTIVGIAGAPGSGKSTIAARLADLLNSAPPNVAAVLPMDGYHFDDTLLKPLGRLARKGAPDTFDVGGFRHLLLRLKDNSEEAVAVPVFDRDIEIARAGARLIDRNLPIIIVEGNYLLLKRPPWNQIKPLFDITVMIDASLATLRRRLTERWQGYDLDPQEVRRRVEENDMPNGLLVMAESAAADYRLAN